MSLNQNSSQPQNKKSTQKNVFSADQDSESDNLSNSENTSSLYYLQPTNDALVAISARSPGFRTAEY